MLKRLHAWVVHVAFDPASSDAEREGRFPPSLFQWPFLGWSYLFTLCAEVEAHCGYHSFFSLWLVSKHRLAEMDSREDPLGFGSSVGIICVSRVAHLRV